MCREASAIDQQLRALNNERKEIAEADKVIMEQYKSMGEEVEKIKVQDVSAFLLPQVVYTYYLAAVFTFLCSLQRSS